MIFPAFLNSWDHFPLFFFVIIPVFSQDVTLITSVGGQRSWASLPKVPITAWSDCSIWNIRRLKRKKKNMSRLCKIIFYFIFFSFFLEFTSVKNTLNIQALRLDLIAAIFPKKKKNNHKETFYSINTVFCPCAYMWWDFSIFLSIFTGHHK